MTKKNKKNTEFPLIETLNGDYTVVSDEDEMTEAAEHADEMTEFPLIATINGYYAVVGDYAVEMTEAAEHADEMTEADEHADEMTEADEHAAVESGEPVLPKSIEELFALPTETIITVSANQILTLFGHEIIAIKKQITEARPPHTLNKLDCPASIENLQQFLVGNRPDMQGYIEINEILSLIVSELVEQKDKRASAEFSAARARNSQHYYRCNCRAGSTSS